MNGFLRVAGKDLRELMTGVGGIVLLVLPPLILVLVGQLRNSNPPVHVLIADTAECVPKDREKDPPCYLRFLLEEAANAIVVDLEYNGDPLEALSNPDVDVVAQFGEWEDDDSLNIYMNETSPMLVGRFLQFAQGIRVAMSVSLMADDEISEIERQTYLIYALDGFPFQPAFLFYPAASDVRLSLLPMVIGAILCILPFVLAAQSLLRERTSGTIEILLAAPGVGPTSIFASKCLVPVAFTLFEVILMLFLADWLFGAYMKADLAVLILLLLPAMLVSALLGVCASIIVTSQAQAIMLTGAYMLSIILFTGFISPLDESSALIRALAYLFPLTFVLAPINSWMFGAPISASLMGDAVALSGQMLVYLAVALAGWRWLLMRI